MDLLLKSEKKLRQKIFYKISVNLMQVAKSGVINKRTAARKISRISKKI